MDISTATPVEIDTAIAALWEKRYGFQATAVNEWHNVTFDVSQVLQAQGVLHRFAKASDTQVREFLAEYSEISESEGLQEEAYPTYHVRKSAAGAWEHYGKAVDAETAADEVLAETEPLEAEYVRRGRWNRAFLVTNGNGHVHRSMNCSTCYATTRYYWVTEYSAKTEAEIVEAAGERACTVCYPTAPVESLSRPTQMFTPDEQDKAKARAEREAKAAARNAAKVAVTVWSRKHVAGGHKRHPDGTTTWSPLEYADVLTTVEYKTVRALSNDLGALVRSHMNTYAMVNGFETPGEAQHRLDNIRTIVGALEERGEDAETIVARNHKRAVKDGGSGWDGRL